MAGRTRLRQVVVVAADRLAAEWALGHELGLHDPFYDPGIAHFGLTNAVLTLSDTFLPPRCGGVGARSTCTG